MTFKRLPSVLGDNTFVNTIKERFIERKRHNEVPESKRLAPDTNNILNAVCGMYGIDKVQLWAAKRGAINEARNMVIYRLRYLRGDSLTTIGKVFDIQSYSTVSSIVERLKIRMKTERILIRLMRHIETKQEEGFFIPLYPKFNTNRGKSGGRLGIHPDGNKPGTLANSKSFHDAIRRAAPSCKLTLEVN